MKSMIPVILVVLMIGGIYGAATQGILKIQGITPKKLMQVKKAAPSAQDASKPADPAPKKEEPKVTAKVTPALSPSAPKPAPPKTDLDKGAEKLAELWNELETETLLKVSADWSEPDLVRVLSKMDSGKVVAYLSAIAKDKPAKASKLSKFLEVDASIVRSPS